MRKPNYDSRLRRLKIIKDPISGNNRFETPNDIEIPILDSDIYVPITQGTKLYNLAGEFYGDPTSWWCIALANGMKDMFDFRNKSVLRIPRNREDILSRL